MVTLAVLRVGGHDDAVQVADVVEQRTAVGRELSCCLLVVGRPRRWSYARNHWQYREYSIFKGAPNMVRPGFQLSVRRGSNDRGCVDVGSGGASRAARIARPLGVGASCALLIVALGCSAGGSDRDGAPANGASATTSNGGSVGATPSAGVTPLAGATPSAGVTTTGSSNQSAPLGFDLTLQGPVPYNDRYSVDLWINGTHYAYGFCGFSLETKCSVTAVYSWSLPSVPVGATLKWEITWDGGFTPKYIAVQAPTTHSNGHTVKVRCAYLGSPPDRTPTCSRYV